MRRRVLLLSGLLIWACADVARAQVRVESVEAPSAGARAGIRPGDVLISWTRTRGTHAIAHGRFSHGFDSRQFEIEELPKGGLAVGLRRGNSTVTLTVGAGLWGVRTGPALYGRDAERYRQGLAAANAPDIVRAVEIWQTLAQDLSGRNPRESVWLYCRIGTLMVAPVSTGFYSDENNQEGLRVDDSDVVFQKAQTIAAALGDPRLLSLADEAAGAAWRIDVLEPDRVSLGRVRKAFGRALRLRESTAVGPLSEAAAAQALGTVWALYDDRYEKPDVTRARQLCMRAVTLRHQQAPQSFEEGYSRLTLALLIFKHYPDERQAAWQEASEAVTILERTAPGSHTLRISRALAGLLAGDLGDYRTAYRLLRLAARPARHTSVDSDIAGMAPFGHHEQDRSLLASMARSHLKNGNLASAAAVLRIRTVVANVEPPVFPAAARQQAALSPLSPADLLQFARAASSSGNARAAAAFYRELLSMVAASDKPSPSREGSGDLACLASSELVALGEGSEADDDRVSTGCQEWTTAKARERDPYGEYELTLARANRRRGDWTTSAQLAQQATSARRDAPSARWQASALWVLGEAKCRGGERRDGISALVEANRLFAATGDDAPPEMLTILGQCERDLGHHLAAERWLRTAIRMAEAQSDKELTAYLVRAFESSAAAGAYSDLAALLVRAGRMTEAFQIAEGGRAQALRRALSERAIPTPARAKWEQIDLEQEQRKRAALWQDYSNASTAARAIDGTPAEALIQSLRSQTLAMELDSSEWSMRRSFVAPEIRALADTAGKAAASLPAVLGSLAAGTVLVEYSVAQSGTTVFVLNPANAPTVSARTLSLPLVRLREDVTRFRQAIESRNSPDAGNVRRQGANLYEALITPIEDLIARGTRVLLVGDGPLTALPFAALVRHRGRSDEQYFIEWKPLLVAPSAATFVLLTHRPKAPEAKLLVAIGDPSTRLVGASASRGTENSGERDNSTGNSDEEPFVPRTSARGGSLPGAAQEVRQIASLEGATARVLVGTEATEARVRALLPEARVLHFATHAVVNQTFLLDSGLRLADPASSPPPYQDNGLLQAWEITEQLDVKADLVTLSACESATGVALPGEGALSIGRAFHAAGARSVVSALWPIDDKATARFMARFYGALHAGSPKVEALRQAQLSFIQSEASDERLAAPQFWAAFQLSGDWQ